VVLFRGGIPAHVIVLGTLGPDRFALGVMISFENMTFFPWIYRILVVSCAKSFTEGPVFLV